MTFRSTARDRGPHHTLLIDTGRATYAVPTYVAVTDTDQAVGLQSFNESDMLYTRKIGSSGPAEVGVRALAFPMPMPGPHRFHMADVKFPIDIVWVYQGRIARIVTANPEDRETWSARGQLVFETPAGALSARNVAVGDHVRLIAQEALHEAPGASFFGRQGTQLESRAVMGVGRLELAASIPLTFPPRARLTAQLANETAAEEAANEGRPQLSDPSALIRGMLEYALDTDPEGRAPDPFLEDDKWTANMLTGGQTYSYVIDSSTLKRWAIGAGVPPESAGIVAQAALSQRGLLSLGDTLQALGIVDSATPTDQGLVVFRRSEEAPTVQVPAPDPAQVGRVAAKGAKVSADQVWYRGDARTGLQGPGAFKNDRGYQTQDGHALGPGIYLSTSMHDARAYSANVYECRINGQLLVESRATAVDIKKILGGLTPDQREMLLSNYDEDPRRALALLVQSYTTSADSWLDAAVDMTRNAGLDTRSTGIEYCEFMRRVFSPACGVFTNKAFQFGQHFGDSVSHAVIWDPTCIKIIKQVSP